MGPAGRLLVVILIPPLCSLRTALPSSPINCHSGSVKEVGPFDENYFGDVEEFTGVPADENLQLVEHLFPEHLEFLELSFTPGDSVAVVRTKKRLDADTQGMTGGSIYYSVMCKTTKHNNSRTLHVTDINDNAPVFEKKDYRIAVSESLPVGSSVLQVSANDADVAIENNKVAYSFLPTEPSDFELRDDGTIVLKTPLDYNIARGYRFTVEAQDPGGLNDTTAVNITVEDLDNTNPHFNHNVYYAAIKENQAGPLLDILPEAIEAKDGDTGINQTVVYSISTVSPGQYLSNFSMDPDSGVITVATGLDREQVGMIVVNIKAAQQDVPQKTADATVFVKVEDVNDNPPRFREESYAFSVFENMPSGVPLFALDVTDEDEAGFSEGYFAVNGDVFTIDKRGTVLLSGNASLDREVVAVDSPNNSLSATVQLNITILDINDNSPQFSALPNPAHIPEGEYSATSAQEVCRITVSDPDYGDNGRVMLSMAPSGPNVSFEILEDGTLLAVGPLDRETKDVYELTIIAADHGTPKNMNVTVLRLSVTDINDHDPKFSQETYSKAVLLKDAAEGDAVLTLSASDEDADNNSLVTYSFSTDYPLLHLDGDTGLITLGPGLSDIVNDTLLNLTAVARDHGLPPRSSTATVLVFLMKASLTGTVAFERSWYDFSVPENEAAGAEVGRVKAQTGSSVVWVTYALQSHGDTFSVDTEGRIQTRRTLDKELLEWYTLTVEAVDSRTPANTALTTVTVQVEDVNEPPVFLGASYSAKVFSIAPYRQPVLQVQALDPDSGEWGRLQYGLREPSRQFEVEPSSGQLYVLSLEGQEGPVTLELKANDCNGEGLSSTTRVEINVEGSSRSDVVVISLNQPVNVVQSMSSSVEASLSQVLGWNVTVIQVWSVNTFSSTVRSPRSSDNTYVSLIVSDQSSNTVIAKDQVQRKLQDEQAGVTAHMEVLFGKGVQYSVVENLGPTILVDQKTVTALAVLLALSIMGIAAQTAYFFIRKHKAKAGSSWRGASENDLIPMSSETFQGNNAETQDENKKRKRTSLDSPPFLNMEDHHTPAVKRTSLESPPFLSNSNKSQ